MCPSLHVCCDLCAVPPYPSLVPRYKLTIAYDGTDFVGWQKQEPPLRADGEPHPYQEHGLEVPEGRAALRTVQAVLERAIREVVREPIELHGSSRTDSGVHARGQVGAFTCSEGRSDGVTKGRSDEGGTEQGHGGTEARRDEGEEKPGGERSYGGWPVERGVDRLMRAINGRLPTDVLVMAIEPTYPEFNPIADAVEKAYSYTLNVGLERSLWDRDYVLHIHQKLDVARMQQGAARFIGEHDFAAFAAAGHGRTSTVRTVLSCRVWTPAPERVRIDISGNGFLWNMVRIIAGTLVDVGRGRKAAEDVTKTIEGKNRHFAGPTLPPGGLCLEWVRYRGISKAADQQSSR